MEQFEENLEKDKEKAEEFDRIKEEIKQTLMENEDVDPELIQETFVSGDNNNL